MPTTTALDCARGLDSFEACNRAYWTRRAESYSEQHKAELSCWQREAWTRELEGRIRDFFPDRAPRELRVLEVGCGPGFLSLVAAGLGCRVWAVDCTPAMLDEARGNAAAEGLAVDFRLGSAEGLDFEDAGFDLVVSRNLTWNLPSPHDAYREWARVLVPGGVLLNYDANWYAYLVDEDSRHGWEEDRARVARSGLRDHVMLGEPALMEELAGELPASALSRPAWDLQILHSLGLEVLVDPYVSDRVWSEEEHIGQASTPLFGVFARKPS